MGVKSAHHAMNIKSALLGYTRDLHFDRIAGFASAEHLGHTVAYDLAANYDPKIPLIVVDEDGKTREYVATLIETENPAIIGHILTPKDKENPRVHVVFRGTACSASVVRDLELGGAGQKSFYEEKDLILSQIAAAIGERTNESDHKVKLSISGHSLGGGDAQNCFATLLDSMTRIHGQKRFKETMLGRAAENIKSALTLRPEGAVINSVNSPFLMVESLTLNHVNSAGVTHATAKRCKKSATYLSKCGVGINVRALRVAGDGIQLTGQTNLLADIESKYAKVEVLKVRSDHEGWLSPKCLVAAASASYFTGPMMAMGALTSLSAYGTFKSHTANSFDRVLNKEDYVYADNSSVEGAEIVKRKLSDKSMADNNPVMHGIKKVAHSFSNMFVRNRKVSPHILAQYEKYQTHLSSFDTSDAELDSIFDDILEKNDEQNIEITKLKLNM
jgi:hypothetical protein